MNSNIQQVHSKLKYACSYSFFPENSLLNKSREKCNTSYSENKFYVEEYYETESLKKRIDVLYNLFLDDFRTQGIDIYSSRCTFPRFVICNKYGESIMVGVSSYGWDISIIFVRYLIEYLEETYGEKQGYKRYLQLGKNQEVSFHLDIKLEPTIISSCDLVSEETAHTILEEFLDTGKTEEELDPEIFRREIAKRNY